jgi:hypothetical protein
MNAEQRTRQQQACHIKFKELQSASVIPDGMTCYDYAREITGQPVSSLKELSDWQLNALRDRLEGKDTKMLARLLAEAERGGIRDLAAWMLAASRSANMAWLRGHRPETLPANAAWRLLMILERRGRGSAGLRAGRQGRRPNGVDSEQALLWGM